MGALMVFLFMFTEEYKVKINLTESQLLQTQEIWFIDTFIYIEHFDGNTVSFDFPYEWISDSVDGYIELLRGNSCSADVMYYSGTTFADNVPILGLFGGSYTSPGCLAGTHGKLPKNILIDGNVTFTFVSDCNFFGEDPYYGSICCNGCNINEGFGFYVNHYVSFRFDIPPDSFYLLPDDTIIIAYPERYNVTPYLPKQMRPYADEYIDSVRINIYVFKLSPLFGILPIPYYPLNVSIKNFITPHFHSNPPRGSLGKRDPQSTQDAGTNFNEALWDTTLYTNEFGETYIYYYSPKISGMATIFVGKQDYTPNKTVVINLGIDFPNFEELQEGENYVLTGSYGQRRCNGSLVTSRHIHNHYGTSLLTGLIPIIANSFTYEFPGCKLRINDMSLPGGGLFDINNNWTPPHGEHRLGNHADIEFNYQTDKGCKHMNEKMLKKLLKIAAAVDSVLNVRQYIHPDHWHLRVKRY